MFAITLLIFVAAAIIWLNFVIGTIQSIQDILILTDNQGLENKFSKTDQKIVIFDTIDIILQTIIVCCYFCSVLQRELK